MIDQFDGVRHFGKENHGAGDTDNDALGVVDDRSAMFGDRMPLLRISACLVTSSMLIPAVCTEDRAIVGNDLLLAGQGDAGVATDHSGFADIDASAQSGGPDTTTGGTNDLAIDVERVSGHATGVSFNGGIGRKVFVGAATEDMRAFPDVLDIAAGGDIDRFADEAGVVFGCNQSVFRSLCLIGGEMDCSAG